MGGVVNALRSLTGGIAEAAGNQQAHDDLQNQIERSRQSQDQARELQIAPLRQALRADQTRLAIYANPDDPSKPLQGKENEYKQTLDRMTQTIGQMRRLYGQKPQGANPIESGAGNMLDALHITNHLKNHVAQVRADNAKKYAGQTATMAGAYATGAMPFEQTPEGQKAAAAQALEKQRSDAALALEHARSEDKTPKIPKGFKAMEQGGMALGVEDQDTGKQYLPDQLGPQGDAPPQAKQIWATIQAIQAGKEARLDQKDKEAQERINQSQERLAHALGAQANQGTWSIAEDGEGNPILFNSKTGEQKEAPGEMHKSGYFAKQIAPLDAAGLNIKSYVDGGVFDGPGDLALQHEFFTATQPSTGFRMTKVQQDILQNSQSWLNSLQAKAHHLATGTWFSDEQRKQIAEAAQDAIDAKKKTLTVAGSAPKTKAIADKAKSDGKSLADRLNESLH